VLHILLCNLVERIISAHGASAWNNIKTNVRERAAARSSSARIHLGCAAMRALGKKGEASRAIWLVYNLLIRLRELRGESDSIADRVATIDPRGPIVGSAPRIEGLVRPCNNKRSFCMTHALCAAREERRARANRAIQASTITD